MPSARERSLLPRPFWCSVAVFMAAGCGTDSEYVDSGVDETVALSDLSPAQEGQLCDASARTSERLLDDKRRGVCMTLAAINVAFGGAVPRQECEDGVERCIEQPPTMIDATECTLESTECTATVAELESCLQDRYEAAAELYDQMGKLDCGDILESFEALQQVMEAESSAACLALQSECASSVDEEFVGPWE